VRRDFSSARRGQGVGRFPGRCRAPQTSVGASHSSR
jgi:hypothetical protein